MNVKFPKLNFAATNYGDIMKCLHELKAMTDSTIIILKNTPVMKHTMSWLRARTQIHFKQSCLIVFRLLYYIYLGPSEFQNSKKSVSEAPNCKMNKEAATGRWVTS